LTVTSWARSLETGCFAVAWRQTTSQSEKQGRDHKTWMDNTAPPSDYHLLRKLKNYFAETRCE
jgi:hypothetical protein